LNYPNIDQIERARKPARLSVVFTEDEVRAILAKMGGAHHLIVSLLYGSGLRLTECLRLRVKDIDFQYQQIYVRDGKGFKDRRTMLPTSGIEPLQIQLRYAQRLHQDDWAQGYGQVFLPNALEKKYPILNREWGWQYVFPTLNRSKCQNVKTMMIYTHVLNRGGRGVRSPLDG
jgi:integrase